MAIKFSGVFEVKKKPEEVYDFLTDPNRFAALLPDFQNLMVHDATHFTLKVNVGISYIKGKEPWAEEMSPWSRALTCFRSRTEAQTASHSESYSARKLIGRVKPRFSAASRP